MFVKTVQSMSLLAALLLSAAAGAAVQEVGPEPATPLPRDVPVLSVPALQPALLSADGRLLSLYVRAGDGRVVLRRGDEVQTLDDDAARKGGGYVRLIDDGKVIYAFWWNKGAKGIGKRLYLRTSKDRGKTFGPLKILNNDNGVLPQYDVVVDGSGRIAVAFMDERTPPGYQIRVNRSTDGGDNWLKEDVRIDDTSIAEKNTQQAEAEKPKKPLPFAIAPRLAFSGERLIAVWQQQDQQENQPPLLRWVSRVSDDGGKSWQAPVDIYREANKIPFELLVLELQGRFYAFGFTLERGLMAFRTDKEGREWEALGPVPGTAGDPGLAISWMRAVASGDHILVSYSTQKQGQKIRAFVARLSSASGKWEGEAWRLDREKDETTKAGVSELTALPDGTVIVAWEDYRNLLPAIYLDYTTDEGANWAKAPLALTDPGQYRATLPRLVPADDRVLVLYNRIDLAEGQKSVAGTFYQTLSFDKSAGLKVPVAPNPYDKLSLKEKQERLKKRATAFWKLREEGKIEETWDYFAPPYRASFPNKYAWMAKQSDMSYSDFAIKGEVRINGLIGKVPYEVSVTMPQQIIGEMIAEVAPPKKLEATMRWGWFHDKWYFMPDTMLKKYLDY
jgi:hypothetical protein